MNNDENWHLGYKISKLKTVHDWAKQNFRFSQNKMKIVLHTRFDYLNNHLIVGVNHVKDLGVFFDNEFKLYLHV